MLKLIMLFPSVVAGFALEQIYILGHRGYGPKRGRFMTHIEAVWTYSRRADFFLQAKLCLLQLRVFIAESRCFFLRAYHRIFFGLDTRSDFSEHFSPKFYREYIQRNPSDIVKPNGAADKPRGRKS